jgi:hypothetical protein
MAIDPNEFKTQLEQLGDFHRFFTSKEIKMLPQVLADKEVVHGITSGYYEGKTWVIVLSNMRLLFLDCGFFYGMKQTDMPLQQISSVTQKNGLIFGEIQVATPSGSKTIGGLLKKEAIKIASILANLIHSRNEPKIISAPIRKQSADTDPIQKLEKLKELQESGLLNDTEVEILKERLFQNLDS